MTTVRKFVDGIEPGGAGPIMTPLTPEELGVFIRSQRQTQGWSQDTLAELSRLSVRTVQRVEEGLPSSLDTRRALARAFGFSDLDCLNKPMAVPDEVEIKRLRAECERLEAERQRAESAVSHLNDMTRNAQMMLNMAAARDARWLHLVRTTLMPKQASRVPFHNAAEIALRGYHCSMRGKPTLTSVTWSLLPYTEGGLHRGYHAGLIYSGSDFAPGVTWAHRFKDSPEGAPDLSNFWRQPNIYFGDRLETSTHADPEEGPVSWRGMEFAVRNPDGEMSDWVEFSYPFDDGKLLESIRANETEGTRLLAASDAKSAVEPLRKAWIRSRALFGWESEEYRRAESMYHRAFDQAAMDRLRFRVGANLYVADGPHAGKVGPVVRILPKHFHAYLIDVGNGEQIQAADNQVEEAA